MIRRTCIIAGISVFALVQIPSWAQVDFVEDFLGNEINSNDWATGDNGWIVSEPSPPNRATVDTLFDGRGRVFTRSDFGTESVTVAQDFTATPITNRVTVTWDYLDGTDASVNRLFAADTNGTNGLILWFTTGASTANGGGSGNLQLEATAAGIFLTPNSEIHARGTDYATIMVTLDPATDLATIWASSDNGVSAGPFTVRFHNGFDYFDLDHFSRFTWENQAVDVSLGGSDWNLTTITIREHPPIVITQGSVSNTMSVTFNSEIGVNYSLECTTDTNALAGWVGTGATVVGDGGSMTLFDPTGNAPSKAYRVIDVPVP